MNPKRKNCKNSLLIVLLFIFILISVNIEPAEAQEDKYSFRLRGMGPGLYGLIDDLYSDISLNPTYIYRYKGTWIFSNLSNFQSGTDVQNLNSNMYLTREPGSTPNNLIGVVSDRFGSSMGLFIETNGLSYQEDDVLFSETFITEKTGINLRNRSLINSDNSVRSITLTGIVRDFGLSLSIYRNDFNLELMEETIDRSFTVNDSSGLKEDTVFLSENSRQKFEFPNSLIAFSLGRIYKAGNQEISFAVGRRPERMAFDNNEVLGLFREDVFKGMVETYNIFDGREVNLMDLGFRSIYLNTKIKNIYPGMDELQQNSFIFNFTKYSMPFNITNTAHTVKDSLYKEGGFEKDVNLKKRGVSKSDGSADIKRIEAGAGIEKHFVNLNTLIGFGAKLDYIWGEMNLDLKPTRINEDLTVDVRIGPQTGEGFNRVINDNRGGVIKNKISGAFVSFPLGIETKLSEKLTLRLGARSVIPLKYKTELEKNITDKTDTVEDDPAYEAEDGFDDEIRETTVFDGKKLNFNSYHFGANYRINQNISIDLLNFSKLTELDTWW
ncbi:hypothetical protein ACFL7D_05965, partial [candidate division KSB1 bacterium]